MFLNKDNTIKWDWVAVAAIVTIALCLCGILWFDKLLYLFLRGFSWKIWGLFDTVFAAKIWLGVTAIIGSVIFIKNKLKTKNKSQEKINWFSVRQIFVFFKEKSKDNYGFLIFYSCALASAVGGVLKFVLGRARPVFFDTLGNTGFYPGTAEWAFNSMPSGHATVSFAGLVMIGLLFPRVKWATWTLAIIIGLSRVCCGAHWPTDVLLGAFIGMISADLVKNQFNNASA